MSARTSPSPRTFCVSVAVALLTIMADAEAVFAQGGFLGLGGDRGVKYRLYKHPANRFEIEYPEKDWKQLPVPVTGGQLARFQHKDDPALVVDHVLLDAAYSKEELEGLPGVELELLRNQERPASEFKSETIQTRSGRGILITYYQVGKGPERVVQCTIALGRDLFRLNAVVPEKMYQRFGPIVLHMMESFRSPATAAVPAAKP